MGRWFTAAPFVSDSSTMILSKMWATDTEPTMLALQDAFPDSGVTFRPLIRSAAL